MCGGEPLLSKTFKPIVESIRSKWAKAPISVLTKGTLLSERNITFLKKNNIDLQVSLDGPNAELHDKKRGKGNFDRSIVMRIGGWRNFKTFQIYFRLAGVKEQGATEGWPRPFFLRMRRL
ncbi:MAG: hypothetical protein H6625_12370 [Bdellovibrionaceae bacterium]|nr:hypothetical protein [Pseudobdellovibrionaceae bacterium]